LTKQRLPSLRDFAMEPHHNPLVEPQSVKMKGKEVQAGARRDFVDAETGEYYEAATIKTIEAKDDAQFVKVFSEGIKATYGLTRTAHRVFQVILDEYERTPMRGGYVDALYLAWFDGGLSGRDVGMSERTFQNGLRELLSKGFLYPKMPNVYWVNPALFFRGDRVRFVREYTRRRATADDQAQERGEDQEVREAAEADGQQRLYEDEGEQ